jgi:hypothetical protein
VKIGKSVSETSAPLTLAYGEYATKKASVFEWHGWSKEGQDVQEDPKMWTAKNAKDTRKCGQSMNHGALRSKMVSFGSAKKVMGICSEERIRTLA